MEGMTIISAIISLVTLIVFFMMASNISRIRTLIELNSSNGQVTYQSLFTKGELNEFKGKSNEALDCYMEAFFIFDRIKNKTSQDLKNETLIKAKIASLGGKLRQE